MENTFLHYEKCATSRKAKKWLDEQGVSYHIRPILTENPTYEELKQWQQASGLPMKKWFNTSGQVYKAMQLKEKLPQMTEDEMLQLLATDGKLIKRPVLVGDGFVLVGFDEQKWQDTLLG